MKCTSQVHGEFFKGEVVDIVLLERENNVGGDVSRRVRVSQP